MAASERNIPIQYSYLLSLILLQMNVVLSCCIYSHSNTTVTCTNCHLEANSLNFIRSNISHLILSDENRLVIPAEAIVPWDSLTTLTLTNSPALELHRDSFKGKSCQSYIVNSNNGRQH